MIAPQGDFCDATKVTKTAVKEREFRFSLSLTILSLKTTKKGAAAPLFGKSPRGEWVELQSYYPTAPQQARLSVAETKTR